MKNQNEIHKCCLCDKIFYGYGNNPYPIAKDGVCCNSCNDLVIYARLLNRYEKEVKHEHI